MNIVVFVLLATAALWQESFAATGIKIAQPPHLSARLSPIFARHGRRHLQANNNISESNSTTIASATGTSCSGDPFLWLIQKDSGNNNNSTTKETVGFAMGTMHVPRELALSGEAAFTSLLHALDDACTVYAELDLNNPNVMNEVFECALEIQAANAGTLATIMDIPDQDMRARYEAALLAITEEYAGAIGPADQLATQLAQTFSLDDIVSMVQAYNTPEYKDSFFAQYFDPTAEVSFLDTELLDEARSTESLEMVATQCKLIQQMATTKDDLVENYETLYAPVLGETLEAPSYLSRLFSAYQCGSVDRVLEFLTEGEAIVETPEAFMTAILDDRNIQMASRIVEILETTTTVPLFAVGLAHWIDGENNMGILLEKEGYTLQRVEGAYDSALLPDWTDARCDEAPTVQGASSGAMSTGLLAAMTIPSFALFFI